MDFSLSEEQRQMQESVREFVETEGGMEFARRQMAGEDVVDELWDELAEMDYTALTVPLEHGGLGDGLLYLSLFLEEAGRFALPGPVPETLGFAVPLLSELGTESQREEHLPAIADGDVRATLALHDDLTEHVPETIQMEATATGDGYRLEGTKTLVPYADTAEYTVVAARTREAPGYGGTTLFFVETARGETTELETLDQTRPLYELEFDGVTVGDEAVLGPVHGGGDALQRAMDRLNVATSAMLVGGAAQAVERSTQHANEREQYGHPIGRFQAVKHRITDMWMDVQGARSLVYYAAWAVENDSPDAPRAVSAAASFCTEQCTGVFGDDIMNHGGMGFTWEHDAHIFLKQAKTWENLLGTPERHRERIADARL